MARPNKKEARIILKRNKIILMMNKKGYPLDYISIFHNLSKGRIVQILKKEIKEEKVESIKIKKNG